MSEIRKSEVKQQTTERIIYDELTKRQQKLKEVLEVYKQIEKIQSKRTDNNYLNNYFTSKAIKNGSATNIIQKAQQLALNTNNDRELSSSFQSYLKENNYSSNIKKIFKKSNGSVKGIVKNLLSSVSSDIGSLNNVENFSSKILADPKQVQNITSLISKYKNEIAKLNSTYQNTNNSQQQAANSASKFQKALNSIQNVGTKARTTLQGGANSLLSNTIFQGFSGYAIFNTIRTQINDTINSIKELDSAFSEIALVTDKSMSDMWNQYSQYNSIARELGTSTTDVIKASALYYQQGLGEADVMKMTADTMKLATLAGEDYSQAVQQITSAIHGFNLENTDSEKIMDTYVNLANKAAISVQDIGSAMNRTASIANTAGMSLEDTAAFISMIGSTTQESAETVGTSVRTMIARFTALKKDVSEIDFSEVGEDFDVNRVQTAIQSAGVAVRDANGETRNWSDVILDLSKKWDTLDKNTKQYVATQAAGTTQQSRFLALVSDYDELVRLMDEANNSSGAAEKQFAKYSDTVEYKINKIKETWQAFTQKFLNSKTFKSILDGVIKILDRLNEADLDKALNLPGLITSLLTVGKLLSSITGKANWLSNLHGKTNNLIGMGTSATFGFNSDEFDKIPDKISTVKLSLRELNSQYELNKQTLQSYGNLNQRITDGTTLEYNKLALTQQNLGTQINTLNGQLTSSSQRYNDLAVAQIKANTSSQLLTSALMNGITAITMYKSGLLTGKQALAQFGLSFGLTVVKIVAQTSMQIAANEALVASYGSVAAASLAALGPALAVVGIVAGVTAVIAGLLALSKHLEQVALEATDAYKATKNLEEAQKSLENAKTNKDRASEAAKESKDELKNTEDLKKEWEQLSKLGSLTEEQQQRKNELAKEISETMPEIVTYYNEETNELITQNSLWEEKIEKLKEANDINKEIAHATAISEYEAEKQATRAQTTSDLVDLGYDYETANIMSKVKGEIDINNPAFENEGLDTAMKLIDSYDDLVSEYSKKFDSLSSENQEIWEDQKDYINESLIGDLDEEFLNRFAESIESTVDDIDLTDEETLNQLKDYAKGINDKADGILEANRKQYEAQREAFINAEGHSIAQDYDTSDMVGRIVAANVDNAKKEGTIGDFTVNYEDSSQENLTNLSMGIQNATELKDIPNEIRTAVASMTEETVDDIDSFQKAFNKLDDKEILLQVQSVLKSQNIQELLTAISDQDKDSLEYIEKNLNNLTLDQINKTMDAVADNYSDNGEDSIKFDEERQRIQNQFAEMTDGLKGYVDEEMLSSTYGVLSALSTQISTVKDELGDLAAIDYGDFISKSLKGLSEEQIGEVLSVDWDSITILNADEMKEKYVNQWKELGISGAETLYDSFYEEASKIGYVDLSVVNIEEFQEKVDELIESVSSLGDSVSTAFKDMASEGEVSFDNFLKVKEQLDELGLNYSDYFDIDKDGKITTSREKLDALMKEQYSSLNNINKKQIEANEAKIDELNKQKDIIKAQGIQTSAVNQTAQGINNITAGYYKAAQQLQQLLTLQNSYNSITGGPTTANIQLQDFTKDFAKNNQEEYKQWEKEQLETLDGQINLYEKANKELLKDSEVNSQVIRAGYRDYVKSMNEAEESTKSASKSTSDLAEKQKALNDKLKEFNELMYGSKNRKSSLDFLYNYAEALSSFNDELSRSKELLDNSKTVDAATNNLEKYANAVHNVIAEEKAQQQAIQSGLDNYEKWFKTAYSYQNPETGNNITVNWSDYLAKDERTGKYIIDQRLLATDKFNDDLKNLLEDQVQNYNKYYDNLIKSEDNVRKAEEEIQERRENALKNYANMEEELANALKDQYKNEVDELKDKYDAMKDADDDYVQALEEAINKQRELRDRENSYEDLAQKERKLSLMQRDTSGGNAAEIAGLEGEIQEDREQLLDEAIDNIVDGLSDLYESQQELRDTEIELKEALIDNTAYWNSEAERLALSFNSAEEYAQYLAGLSEEYSNMTLAQQQAKLLEYAQTYEQASEYMALQALDSTSAIGDYITETISVTEAEVSTIVASTAETFSSEATRAFDEVTTKFQESIDKIVEELNKAREALQEATDAANNNINSSLGDDTISNGNANSNNNGKNKYPSATNGNSSSNLTIDGLLKKKKIDQKYIDNASDAVKLQLLSRFLGSNNSVDKGDLTVLKRAILGSADLYGTTPKEFLTQALNRNNPQLLAKYLNTYKFADGGLVDYTGPAWVDGSYAKPEAFLSSQDTERIGNAAKILSDLPLLNSQLNNSTTNNAGEINIEINLNIDSIDSEVDVENMIDRMKEEIVSAAKPIGSNIILSQ